MALIQNSCQNLALVGLCFGGSFGGGGWRFGAGGGRCVGWPCVSCVVFDVLLCLLTKYFFRVCLLVLSSLLFSLMSSMLPGEFFPLLCLLAWLAVAFFRSGLLCRGEP